MALARRFSDLAEVARRSSRRGSTIRATLAELGLTPDDAALFHRLAAPVLFTGRALRSRRSVAANRLGQPGLWPHAISGDLPIVLARLAGPDELDLAGELLRATPTGAAAASWWTWSSWTTPGRPMNCSTRLEELVRLGPTAAARTSRAGCSSGRGRMPADDVILLEAAARASSAGTTASLAEQLERAPAPHAAGRAAPSSRATAAAAAGKPAAARSAAVLQRPGRVHAGRPRVRR